MKSIRIKGNRIEIPVRRRRYKVESLTNPAMIAKCAANRARRAPMFEQMQDAAAKQVYENRVADCNPKSQFITTGSGRKP